MEVLPRPELYARAKTAYVRRFGASAPLPREEDSRLMPGPKGPVLLLMRGPTELARYRYRLHSGRLRYVPAPPPATRYERTDIL